MPWIEQIPVEKSAGLLKSIFDAAIERAGRVWNIVHIMSLNPQTLQSSLDLYQSIMHRESPLSRYQRELLATVVSNELACPY